MSANECPVDGCTAGRRSNQLMCKSHWYKVPKAIRDEVWATAKAMWRAERKGGLTSDEWTETYQAWSEARDKAVHAVEAKEAES